MVKAEIIFPDGTKIVVDGDIDDIIEIKKRFNEQEKVNGKKDTLVKNVRDGIKTSKGPLGRSRLLIKEDFFKEKRTIKDILKKLKESVIFYNAQSLSPALLRLIRKGELRRIREEKDDRM